MLNSVQVASRPNRRVNVRGLHTKAVIAPSWLRNPVLDSLQFSPFSVMVGE